MRTSIRIIGIDPGSIITGYGVIDSNGQSLQRVTSGTIAMKSSEAMSLRLQKIYKSLIDIMDEYAPDEFCIETAFYGKNVQSTLKLGHVRGVAILAAVHRQLAIAEYTPREVKRSVTGTGAAAKQQIEFMVKTLLNLKMEFSCYDEADGLALAICHAFHINAPRKQFKSWKEYIVTHPERIQA